MAQIVKSLPAMLEICVRSLGQEIPWRGKWPPTPVFLPGESHRQRNLAGYSLWGCKESDMTEQLTHTSGKLQIQEILNLIDPISVSWGQALSTPRVFEFEWMKEHYNLWIHQISFSSFIYGRYSANGGMLRPVAWSSKRQLLNFQEFCKSLISHG